MKRIVFLLLIIPSIAYAVETTKIDGPADVFGPIEGSDVGFGVITGTQMRAGAGVFDNITVNSDLVLFDTSGTPGTDDAVLSYSSSRLTIMTDSGDISLEPQNGSTKLSGLNIGIPTGAISLSLASNVIMNWSDAPSNYTAGKDIGLERYAVGLLKVNKGVTGTEGALISPGVFTSFRNLSSSTETLTITDYFINCLANDNEVVITMPAINVNYSQTLIVKYTDSGSTNKCKLDGNGAEQIEGFDVYSGLDTYKESAIFKSDGVAWWKVGGL